MFERAKAFIRKVGVRMGLIKELNAIQDHKKIEINEEAYDRMMINKEIYQGYVPSWHDVNYRTSAGVQKDRRMMSMGMGKVLAHKMSNLIFNEKAVINIEEGSANKFVQETLRHNGFYKHFQRYLEYGYALSGMAIKVYEYNGRIKLAYANADAFYPLSNDSENVDEALFVNEEFHNGKHYTLLEWNQWEGNLYKITNELYESETKGKLGHKVPLSVLYEGLEPEAYLKGLRRPIFVYFKLNTANNKDMTSPLGISIFENSYDTLYMLDYLYDFFLNEFKLGRRRIAVDQAMLKPFLGVNGEQHMAFDTEETVFTPLNMEEQPVKDLSVEIRATDIIKSINALLDILCMQTGLSSGTFTFDGSSVKTATEVVSENSMTYQTKNGHEVLVEEGIKELIISIVDMAKQYNLYDGPEEFDVGIDFDDSIAQDRNENLKYYSSASGQGLIPKKEAIMRTFNVTEEVAKEWMKQIAEEKPATVSDEGADFFGVGAGNVGE